MKIPTIVPSRDPEVFADHIVAARSLCSLAEGTADEAACWRYYAAVVGLAWIATGHDALRPGALDTCSFNQLDAFRRRAAAYGTAAARR